MPAKPAPKTSGQPAKPSALDVLKALFTGRLRLTRGKREAREQTESPSTVTPSVLPDDPAPLMRRELTALLDRAPDSRRVVRHLAAIEHGLARKDKTGLFIFDMPLERLQSAQRELDTLAAGTLGKGLVALRGRLVAAAAAHEARERKAHIQQPVSSFLNDDKLEVGDARHSDFDKATAAWLQPAPGGKPVEKKD